MEKSKTNKGINRLSLSLYLNYIAHGFALLIVAQNMTALSAASDIMQAALVAFMRLYPQHRGLVTGVFYFFGSIASFTVPIITGKLSTNSIGLAFSCDLIIAIVALILATILHLLSKKQ